MKVLDSDVMKADVRKKFEDQIRELQEKEIRNRQVAEQIALRQGIHIDPQLAQYTQNLQGPKIVLTEPGQGEGIILSRANSRRS